MRRRRARLGHRLALAVLASAIVWLAQPAAGSPARPWAVLAVFTAGWLLGRMMPRLAGRRARFPFGPGRGRRR